MQNEKSVRHQLAAHVLHSKHDSKRLTARARAAFFQKFLDQVDPDRTLTEQERLRRAEHALQAHMLRLAYASARSRRLRREASSP